jgi:hypothetical protein
MAMDMGSDTAGECEVYDRTCPKGHKCAHWDWQEQPHCFPIAPMAKKAGEPCSEQPESGQGRLDPSQPIDSCGDGLVCNGEYCQEYCQGHEGPNGLELTCSKPAGVCKPGRAYYLCDQVCHPLVQDCPSGQQCSIGEFYPEWYECFPSAPEPGADGEPCGPGEGCWPGSLCVDAAWVPDCAWNEDCCTSFCDLSAPNPDMLCLLGQKCMDVIDDEAESPYESIGVCRVP